MTGLADLLESERGVFALLALACATILAALHVIDPPTWLDFVKYLCAALIASKTITSSVQIHADRQSELPKATALPKQ